MKRSASRSTKATNDNNEITESLIPGLSVSRWKEILEKEENDLFILGIREDIVNNCLNICYDKYLEKQAVAFTVHCAYLAWIKVIDVYYMHKDGGDTEDPIVRSSWEPDEEPESSIIDSWASQCIKAYHPEPDLNEKKREKKLSIYEEKSYPLPEGESLESISFFSNMFDHGEILNFSYSSTLRESKSTETSPEKSAFSKALSMSREFLPLGTNATKPCLNVTPKKKK